MIDLFSAKFLFFVLFGCFHFSEGSVSYHILPAPDASCLKSRNCLSLSQLTNNASNYIDNAVNVSLIFLPGRHILGARLVLSNFYNLLISADKQANESVLIDCSISRSGSFVVSNSTFVAISGLYFIGCGGNSISKVSQFMMQDSTFQGKKGRKRALSLYMVTDSIIVGSKFFSNICSISANCSQDDTGGVLVSFWSSIAICDCDFVNNSAMYGGVLQLYSSPLLVANSTFVNNNASYGGAVYMFTVAGTSASIIGSTFSNNCASFGGALQAFGYSLVVKDDVFSSNCASISGGVMYIRSGSPFNISGSVFVNNNAYCGQGNRLVCGHAGVMDVYDSTFTIDRSTFVNNIATQMGGVMSVVNSSFDVTYSSFLNNLASRGAVIKVWTCRTHTCFSMFTIMRCNFSDNFAFSNGGVMETTESSFAMGESLFSNNVAYSEGGCIYAYAAVNYEASIRIVNCTFTNNSSSCGSVMEVFGSFVTIENSTLVHNLASKEATILAYASPITINGGFFAHNRASRAGVVSSVSSNATSHIVGSTFLNNSAPYGGVFSTNESPLNVTMCTFARNAALYGGVLQTLRTLVVITRSVFIENVGYFSGGVMYVLMNSSITILRSSFTNNLVSVCKITANDSFNPTNNTLPTGGVLTSSESIINIVSSTFTNNCAPRGGVMEVAKYSHVNIINSTFDENSASQGAVMATDLSTITINQSTLYNNSADVYGGVIVTLESKFDIVNSEFSKNSGKYGGVLFGGTDLILSIINSTFTDNYAESIGLVDIGDSLLRIDNSAFYNNIGSIYAFLCNVTISGYTKFEYCIEPHFKKLYLVDATTHQGGAITAYRSTLVFTGISSFVHNQASYGGAIVATESTLVMYGETVIAHNVGIDDSGGGIYLHQSNVDVYGNCNISQNFAFRGGGIHASSSTISVHQPGTLLFTNNSADLGGAVYFEESPKLNVLKHYNTPETLVAFAGNHAVYGGAVFVADDQRSSACSLDVECFVQTLALTQFPSVIPISTLNIIFSDNSADVDGSNLFGGQLDRCVSSPFAEIYLKQQLGVRYDGVSYLGMISNIMSDSIASTPTRVCFCTIEGVVDCDLELDLIRVTKGEKFPVSIAAVDQVNHPIGATIISLLSSSSILSEGQQSQHVNASCTDITFNVFSQDSSDVVTLFADGPCGSSAFSTRNFSIEFLDCTCLIGFQPSESTLTDCECICDPSLFPYITTCNYSSHSLLRTDTNSWITFTNDTYPPGYIIHSNCPFDYCHPPFLNISFDLNLASGSDAQCAYNRTGLLCGECGQNLSVSLGSSLCLECPRHWYAIFLGVIAASILAGVLLVAVVLALNLTVATGLVAGFIFYANIVAVNVRLNVFFSSSAMKFATVFVAWLNLEIGFDVCFFDGLDTYAKTWLELVFPVYIITLVLLIILMSRHSPRFTRLIGRRDPVSTLATLILLSYAKMLSVTIDVLSYAVLDYPDGSQDIVWLPDASVKYCQGKHIGLFVAALLIVMIGIPYTFLLFSWQWLVKSPKWSCLKWTRNTKLNFFITTHHTPYNSRHRYWTGLTLLIRVILYITAATTESSNPKVVPLLTVFLVGGLVFVKGIFGMRIYVNLFADIVDTIINFNIIVLAVFSLYDLNAAASEIAAVYTSTIITLILFLVIVIHQAYRYLRVKKCGRYSLEVNEYSEALQERIRRSEITYSVIDAPVHLSSAAEDNDNLQLKLIEGEVEGYADDY